MPFAAPAVPGPAGPLTGRTPAFSVAADRYLDLRGVAQLERGLALEPWAGRLRSTCLDLERARLVGFDTGLVHVFVDADVIPGLRTMRALAPALNAEEQLMIRAAWIDRQAVRRARADAAARRQRPKDRP